ncbi:alpha/beta fold hydrolase [Thalassovita sp.]|jgi:pimeloyl-ACP methyl ester carboxylesterase|uniref:alpha/beta fold hydrolase n=1 Tax=Thalassovita sp. TaxID=1979401 RepID=UPI003B5A2284
MLSHHIELNGQPFHYLGWGTAGAPVMLFLHGFPEYSGAWADFAPQFADRFHCIAPDQRGYGQSWAPAEVSEYQVTKLVSDMIALLDHLDAEQAVVVGHDWGAAVAYALGFMAPDRVSHLVILNGVHPGPFQSAMAAGGPQTDASQYIHTLKRDGSEDWLAGDDFNRLLQVFSAKMDQSWLTPDLLAAYKREWARPGRMRGMVNWYRASPLQLGAPGEALEDLPAIPHDRLHIPMPHLLIWGTGDTALLPESTAGLETYCADLTRQEVEGADHWIIHQQPERAAQIIRDWLDARA